MFRFSLEAVLDVRRRSEEAAQRHLKEATDALEAIERRIARLRARLEAAEAERAEMMRSAYHPGRLALYVAFAEDTGREIERTRLEAVEAGREVGKRRRRLIEAARETQIIEELKKAEYEDFLRKDRSDERKRNDDIAIFSFSRRREEKLSAGPKV
jgi:flagellar export protein FliJ